MNLDESAIQMLEEFAAAKPADDCAVDETRAERDARNEAFAVDTKHAVTQLVELGLIERAFHKSENTSYIVTDKGRRLAERIPNNHPPTFWYQEQDRDFYRVAHRCQAYGTFCRTVYGRDLCQYGQTRMESLDSLRARLEISPDHHVLDLGCGTGGISAYLHQQSGAFVTGVDLSTSAIAVANRRYAPWSPRIRYETADMNALPYPPASFDVAVSFDSISRVEDMPTMVTQLRTLLRPGGKLLIVSEHRIPAEASPSNSTPDNTRAAQALVEVASHFESGDDTASLEPFWNHARATAMALQADFKKEKAEVLADEWINYADSTYMPLIHARRIRRYEYLACFD